MSRMVQARVTDQQYDYLADRAFHVHDGDLSAALRESIIFAGYFEEILRAPDATEALHELRVRWEQESYETRTSLRMDQPDDEDRHED